MTNMIRTVIRNTQLNLSNTKRYPSGGLRTTFLTVILVGGVAVFAARAYDRGTHVDPPPAETVVRSPATSPQSKPIPLGSELVTLQPFGFEPQEITRPVGPFLLMVDNRSGSRDVTLLLDRTGGNRLRTAQVLWHKLDWRETLDLQPGTYLLTEAGNPTWTCQITITD